MLEFDTISVVILLAAGVAIWWMLRGIPKSQARPLSTDRVDAAQDREDLPYRVFTSAFDVECTGEELEGVLANSGSNIAPTRQAKSPDPEELWSQFTTAYRSGQSQIADLGAPELDGYSVLLLLDQSGSMAERMPRVAGSVRASLDWLEEAGALTMLAGFTTVGWQGGQSRKQWSKAGRPDYPGRLCDLLHIIYSPFERATQADDFEALTRPEGLFENVDGEALLWAREKLNEAPGNQRVLIILSDGAPVDDSTLAENGSGILWRHLKEVIAELEADDDILIGAIGLDHRVDELYAHSRVVDEPEEGEDSKLAPVIIEVIAQLDQL